MVLKPGGDGVVNRISCRVGLDQAEAKGQKGETMATSLPQREVAEAGHA